ncbi:MAG TPA: response regulator, partial [Chitinophaga sp.]
MRPGPIIVIEDDIDDKEIFETVMQELNVSNPLIWFNNCDPAWAYLKTTSDQPFIIFCDVNLPRKNGIEFKREIDEDHQLRKKSIPFVFYSTAVNQHIVNEAYTQMTVQGFFQKSIRYDEMK